MIITVNAKDEIEAYVKTFSNLFRLNNNPADKELLKESVASIYINNPITSTRYHVDEMGFKTTNHDYSELIKEGNEFSKIEANYWNKEFFISGKIKEIIHYLRTNRMSKRAIINLWTDEAKDLCKSAPCLTYLNLRVTSNGLSVIAHMRANNAYKCLLIDLDAFRALQRYVAQELAVQVGEYIHFVDSLHFYKIEELQINALYAKIYK